MNNESEYERGYKAGLAIMRSYILEYLKTTHIDDEYPVSEHIRNLPPPTFPTEGVTLQTPAVNVHWGDSTEERIWQYEAGGRGD